MTARGGGDRLTRREVIAFESFLRERQTAMNTYATTGKRVLKGDIWHDDNGPIPDTPLEWSPP